MREDRCGYSVHTLEETFKRLIVNTRMRSQLSGMLLFGSLSYRHLATTDNKMKRVENNYFFSFFI